MQLKEATKKTLMAITKLKINFMMLCEAKLYNNIQRIATTSNDCFEERN